MILLAVASVAATWADAPTVVAQAVAPIEADLRACMKKPHVIGIIASRGTDGATSVSMPVYGVGGRGFTAEEKCLLKQVARLELPPLPAGIERVNVGLLQTSAWDTWRDLTVVIVDEPHAKAFAACKASTVRLVIDRAAKTRVWLPEWQFKNAAPGVRSCLRKAIAGWTLPVLPPALGELQLTVRP
jgi:hypothetical protein